MQVILFKISKDLHWNLKGIKIYTVIKFILSFVGSQQPTKSGKSDNSFKVGMNLKNLKIASKCSNYYVSLCKKKGNKKNSKFNFDILRYKQK